MDGRTTREKKGKGRSEWTRMGNRWKYGEDGREE